MEKFKLSREAMPHRLRTTIGIKTITKDKMDKNRAPGQCYDGFICQMVDLWERTNGNSERMKDTYRM